MYVTHDQQEAIFMGDRIAIMRAGKIEQFGTFDEVYYSPVNLFVATFIGTPPIALIPASVEGSRLYIKDEATEAFWQLPADLAAKIPAGDIRLGVRPEGWQVTPQHTEGVLMNIGHIERLYTERAGFAYGPLSG